MPGLNQGQRAGPDQCADCANGFHKHCCARSHGAVELSGSGESVLTANLEPGGYTVQYTNTSGHLIVKPVNRDGSTGSAFINANETSGVTTYPSTGPVTLKIENTRGPWTLRFVPLT